METSESGLEELAAVDELVRERRFMTRLQQVRPTATFGLIAVCVILWALSCWSPSEPLNLLRMPEESTLVAFGAQENGGSYSEWWRLFAAAFLHLGLVHLAFNCYALWILGSFQEGFFGHGRFLLVYMVSALSGSLATLWLLSAGNPSAGASGAVFGLLGAQFVVERLETLPVPLRRSLWKGVLPFIVGNLLFGVVVNHFAATVQLNNFAHVGGMVGGALVAFALRGRPQEDGTWTLAAALGWALTAVALVACGCGVWSGLTQNPGVILFGHPI